MVQRIDGTLVPLSIVVPVVTAASRLVRITVISSIVSRSTSDVVHPFTAIVPSRRPFTSGIGTPLLGSSVGGRSPPLARHCFKSVKSTLRLVLEDHVGMLVEHHTVSTSKIAVPRSNSQKSIVHGEHWSVAGTDTSNVTNDVVSLNVEGGNRAFADSIAVGLIEESKHLDNRSVLGLSNKLSEGTDVVEGSLSVGKTHDTVHPVDGSLATRVVPAVYNMVSKDFKSEKKREPTLRTGDRVKVKINPQSILPSPFDSFQKVLPRNLGEIRLALPDFDSKEGNRNSHPVEARSDDFGKVTL